MAELAIFAKKRTNADGKPFTSFLSSITRKDGKEVTVSVKFREDAGVPKAEKCPMNIVVEKKDCNLVARQYTTADGAEAQAFTLWVAAWKEGKPYVDHSLDDFDL